MDDPFETSEEVAAKYYKGSENGVIPHYENEAIKIEKERRKQIRIAD